jgi:hypothetical protein
MWLQLPRQHLHTARELTPTQSDNDFTGALGASSR